MSAHKTILVLGAGFYNRRVFAQIREIGFRVVAADRNPDAPGFAFVDQAEAVDITNPEGILEVARRHRVDGVMPINDFGVPTAAFVTQALGLPGVTPETAEAATDKGVMRDHWKRAGLAIPRYRVIRSLEEAKTAVAELGFPLVMKPTNSGGGGRGVSVLSSDEDVEWAYQFALPHIRHGAIIVEEFLDGTEMTIEGLSYQGNTRILAMSDKYKPPLRYRVATALNYPALFPQETLDQVEELVVRAVAALGIRTGASHTEVIVTPEGPKLVEMGARPGGGHIFSEIVREVTGINMVQELSKIVTGQEPDLEPKWRRGCVYRFFNPPAGVVRAITGVEEARALPGVVDLGIVRKPGDVIGDLANSFERSGLAVVSGADRTEAIARADEVERTVVFHMDPVKESA